MCFITKKGLAEIPSFSTQGCSISYHQGGDSFDKPLLIIEGLDPFEVQSGQDIYDKYNAIGFTSIVESEGYDILCLSWSNSRQNVHQNVEVLKNLLNEINSLKTGDYEIIIIGQCMGAVISRLALVEMENTDIDHNVGLFVSFDAPYKGANIPLGLQKFVTDVLDIDAIQLSYLLGLNAYRINFNFISKIFNGPSIPDPYQVYDILNSDAPRQFLIYHYNYSPNTMQIQLQEYLDSVGYPSNCRNIALINGSNSGIGAGFNPGATFFEQNFGACILLSYRHDIKIEMSGVNTTNDQVSKIIIDGTPLCINFSHKIGYGNFGNFCYDNAPGGNIGSSDFSNQGIESFCFVPTVSSIDLAQNTINSDGLNYFNENNGITADYLIANNLTPFKAIYARNDGNNTQHANQDAVKDILNDQINVGELYSNNTLRLRTRAMKFERDYYAYDTIEANEFNIKAGAKVTFKSNMIILDKNFEVEAGAEFITINP
jgi:hypothetical protein